MSLKIVFFIDSSLLIPGALYPVSKDAEDLESPTDYFKFILFSAVAILSVPVDLNAFIGRDCICFFGIPFGLPSLSLRLSLLERSLF